MASQTDDHDGPGGDSAGAVASPSNSAAHASSKSEEVIWNAPNAITLVRLVLSVVVFALIVGQFYLAALVLFILAAGTDWVDGYLARKWNQVTQLGRVLDPLVDKVIICGTFVLLAEAMADLSVGIRGWMAVIVVVRELVVTALRSLIEQRGGDFSARMSGKLKMVFQCAAAVAGLIALMWLEEPPSWLPRVALIWTVWGLAWLAVLSTIYSGVGYVWTAIRMLRS